MANDGFSVKTTITQLGNVARAQLKGQQPSNPDAPATAGMLRNVKRTDRVKKPSEERKQRLDPDKQRRGGDGSGARGDGGPPPEGAEQDRDNEHGNEPVEPGSVIDTTA